MSRRKIGNAEVRCNKEEEKAADFDIQY